jgi:hypothetical protein
MLNLPGMTKKVIPIGIALTISTIFLLLVLAPGGCAFNMLPYLIHEKISKGGEGEGQFIKGFDWVVGIAIFFVAYKISVARRRKIQK